MVCEKKTKKQLSLKEGHKTHTDYFFTRLFENCIT